MKKLFLLVSTIALILTTSPILADSTSAPTSSSTVSASSLTVYADAVTVNANTVIINSKGVKIINATIAKSVNLRRTDTYYRPEASDLPFLKGLILSKSKVNMAAVDMREYAANEQQPSYADTTKREYTVLGWDSILRSEIYDPVSDSYTTVKIPKDIVTKSDAIMDIYKSLGKNQYDVSLYTRASGTGDNVAVEDSPLSKDLSFPGAKINDSTYYTDVFVTRTKPEAYWAQARQDGILASAYETEGSNAMSTADFLNYVATTLQTYGEPVLTEKEMSMLLVAYGKKLPTYLPSNLLSSVEYLLARGIIDDSMNFNSTTLDRDTMLTILMRAKDKNSRLTFKDITIPYMSDLVKDGYYPTATVMQKSPIQHPVWTTNSAAANYYDYYVKVTPATTFHNANGAITNNLYISTKSNDISPSEYTDSQLLGIDNGYYHFQVPIGIKDDSVATTTFNGNQYITLNSTIASDTPEHIELQYGGGVYNTVNTNSVLGPYCTRVPFDATYPTTLVDANRKLTSQSNMTSPIKLANTPPSSTLSFYSSNIKQVLWGGAPITTASGFKDLKNNQYSITVDDTDPYREIMSMITVQDASSDTTTLPAYVKDGNNAMVSLSYLKRNGLIDDVVALSPTQYMLYSENSNIYIDTNPKKRLIVSGQCVTEIPPDDTSPLIVKEPNTNEYLIDYRAVVGVSNGYMIFKNTSGDITVSLPDNGSSYYNWKAIYPLLGASGNQSIRALKTSSGFTLSLEDSYPLANFLIYRSRSSSSNSDYMIVFKPLATSNKPSAETVKLLKSLFDITLGSKESAVIYSLNSSDVYMNSPIKKMPPSVTYNPDYGYEYTPPDIGSFNYYSYLNNSDDTYALPLTHSGSTLIDCNVNILNEPDVRGYPEQLLNPALSDTLQYIGYYSDLHFNTTSGFSFENNTNSITGPLSITAAPAGVQGRYYPFPPVDWGAMQNTNGDVFFGTSKVQVSSSTNQRLLTYSLDFNGLTISGADSTIDVLSDTSVQSPFTEVFRGSANSVYVYDAKGDNREATLDKSSNTPGSEQLNATAGYKNLFNWANYIFNHALGAADDALTIAIYFLLAIVPRIMLFFLIGISALSLIATNRTVILFCDNVIDIFWLISFGLLTVHKIDKRSIILSTFFAIVLLSLMNSGQILNIIAWGTRGLEGIIGR